MRKREVGWWFCITGLGLAGKSKGRRDPEPSCRWRAEDREPPPDAHHDLAWRIADSSLRGDTGWRLHLAGQFFGQGINPRGRVPNGNRLSTTTSPRRSRRKQMLTKRREADAALEWSCWTDAGNPALVLKRRDAVLMRPPPPTTKALGISEAFVFIPWTYLPSCRPVTAKLTLNYIRVQINFSMRTRRTERTLILAPNDTHIFRERYSFWANSHRGAHP